MYGEKEAEKGGEGDGEGKGEHESGREREGGWVDGWKVRRYSNRCGTEVSDTREGEGGSLGSVVSSLGVAGLASADERDKGEDRLTGGLQEVAREYLIRRTEENSSRVEQGGGREVKAGSFGRWLWG